MYEVQRGRQYEVVSLLTTVTQDYDRVSMHGVRRALLERQAESLGIPLAQIPISRQTSNQEYEDKMRAVLTGFQKAGVSACVFGDLFLEDLRKYREKNLAQIGMKGLFPLWDRDTAGLARTIIGLGFKAVVTCVDSKALDKSFAGRTIDEAFMADLPPGVDPCGENGEFHSFVYGGPNFGKPVAVTVGETVQRDGFYFCDLVPA